MAAVFLIDVRLLLGEVSVHIVIQRPILVCLAIATWLIWSTNAPAQNQPKPDGTGNKEAAVFEGAQGKIVQLKLGNNIGSCNSMPRPR